MRTVVAVTAPFVAICPNALTQSPTANDDDVAASVWDNVVDVASVTLSFCVLGAVGFLVVLELLVLLVGRVN
jgi:hypothetical protein